MPVDRVVVSLLWVSTYLVCKAFKRSLSSEWNGCVLTNCRILSWRSVSRAYLRKLYGYTLELVVVATLMSRALKLLVIVCVLDHSFSTCSRTVSYAWPGRIKRSLQKNPVERSFFYLCSRTHAWHLWKGGVGKIPRRFHDNQEQYKHYWNQTNPSHVWMCSYATLDWWSTEQVSTLPVRQRKRNQRMTWVGW